MTSWNKQIVTNRQITFSRWARSTCIYIHQLLSLCRLVAPSGSFSTTLVVLLDSFSLISTALCIIVIRPSYLRGRTMRSKSPICRAQIPSGCIGKSAMSYGGERVDWECLFFFPATRYYTWKHLSKFPLESHATLRTAKDKTNTWRLFQATKIVRRMRHLVCLHPIHVSLLLIFCSVHT